MDKESADKLVQKMNAITTAFKDKVDCVDDLLVETEDIIDESSELVTAEIEKPSPNVNLAEVLNLQNMIDDVKYIRETLAECSSTGKKLLKSMAQEIEMEPDARLLEGYSALCNVINENMKLYLQCYRDMSSIVLNLSKAQSVNNQGPKEVTNIIVDDGATIKSTAELIKELAKNS